MPPAAPPASLPGKLPSRHRRRFMSLRVIFALMLREMATTYGRSPGGYIWAVLEPAGGIALLTLVFAAAFRSPPLGTNFPIFYASGMVPFLMYTDISGKVALSLQFSKPLLAYPSVTFLDALLARFVLNLLTQLLVSYIIFVGLLMLFETRTAPDLPKISLALAMAAALALGVGTFNCVLMSMIPVWQRLWSILNRPLFIISGIFFLFGTIPEPWRGILWYNPLMHVVGEMRAGFYPSYTAAYVSPAYVFGVSFTLLATGLLFLRRYHRDIQNN